jgi:hypothetical protein
VAPLELPVPPGFAARIASTSYHAGDGPSGSLADLSRRRHELAQRVAALTLDLGGLTYEMAVRDHYRLDVIAQRAAELQKADAELDEIQRLLAAAEDGVHGQCRSCGAVHSRGAAYCWRCGAQLRAEARPTVLAAGAGSQEAGGCSAGTATASTGACWAGADGA